MNVDDFFNKYINPLFDWLFTQMHITWIIGIAIAIFALTFASPLLFIVAGILGVAFFVFKVRQ